MTYIVFHICVHCTSTLKYVVHTVWTLSKLLPLDEELFSEKAVGCTASYFVINYMMFPFVL